MIYSSQVTAYVEQYRDGISTGKEIYTRIIKDLLKKKFYLAFLVMSKLSHLILL